MLLRAWMGANEAAIAMRMPRTMPRTAPRSRARARALAVAGDDDLEVAVRQRVALEQRLPSTIRPAYASRAMSSRL
jgi:hypothetical protein